MCSARYYRQILTKFRFSGQIFVKIPRKFVQLGRVDIWKNIWHPGYRRLGAARSRSGRERKNLAYTWIRCPDNPARTNRYTDYAIPALEKLVRLIHLTAPHAFMACFRVKFHYLYLYNKLPV